MASSSDDACNDGRGITVMKKVIKARQNGVTFVVEFNDKGQPVGKNGTMLLSYIGAITRQIVPINIPDWGHVPTRYKNSVWDNIKAVFVFDDCFKSNIMKVAGVRFRTFKTNLSRLHFRDKKGNLKQKPPKKYAFIEEEVWKEFVASRSTPEFLELSKKNQQRAKKPSYPYRRSRKGYAGIEYDLVREPESSSRPSSSQPSSFPREVLWEKARTDKEGDIVDESVKEVVKEINLLSQQASKDKFDSSRRDDVLARALNKKEYPGRVRGLGFGVTQTQYFGVSKRCCSHQEDLEMLKMQLAALQSQMMELSEIVRRRTQGEEQVEEDEVDSASVQGSCSEAHFQIQLQQVQNPEASPPSKDKGKEIARSGHSEESTSQQLTPFLLPLIKPHEFGTPSVYIHGLAKYVRVMNGDEKIEFIMEREILFYAHQVHIGLEEIFQLLRQEQIGASHISVYIRWLYNEKLTSGGIMRCFGFLCPHRISAAVLGDTFDLKERSRYIADALLDGAMQDRLFIAPYKTEEHWILIVLDPIREVVYYLDPLHGNVCDDVRELVETALLQFRAKYALGEQISKSKKIKWSIIKCPRQANNVDCGYYVLRFMQEIIEHKSTAIPLMYFQDSRCASYSQLQIDEVRGEWSRYVMLNA